jgi:hypothetical protein
MKQWRTSTLAWSPGRIPVHAKGEPPRYAFVQRDHPFPSPRFFADVIVLPSGARYELSVHGWRRLPEYEESPTEAVAW